MQKRNWVTQCITCINYNLYRVRLLSFLNRSSHSWQIYSSNSWLYCLQACKSILVENSLEKKLFVMVFKLDSVAALYLAGKLQVAFVRALQCMNVNTFFVSRIIARYRGTGSVARRQGWGQKKTATSAEMVRKVNNMLLDRANGDSILLKMLHYDFSVHTAQNEASIEKISWWLTILSYPFP